MKNKQIENNRQLRILIGTTSDGNDGVNRGGGSNKKNHPAIYVYILIGLIIVAAILLVIVLIKIRRHKCMLVLLLVRDCNFCNPQMRTYSLVKHNALERSSKSKTRLPGSRQYNSGIGLFNLEHNVLVCLA